MEKGMRDLDKIREDYEFHLDSRQVKLLILALSTICFLILVLGFLIGRYFPHGTPSREYASTITTPLIGSGHGASGEASSPEFKFDFFEELSGKGSRVETPEEKPARPTGRKPEAKAPPPDMEASQSVASTPSSEGAGDAGETGVSEVPAPAVQAPKTLLSGYTIQVGAFEDPEGAERLSKRLKRRNYPSYVLKKTVLGKGTWHRVRVGRYTSRAEADRVARLLEEREGLTTFVTLYARN